LLCVFVGVVWLFVGGGVLLMIVVLKGDDLLFKTLLL